MIDPSLNRRLDHHARRSGFAIGASMALTIVLLIGIFVAIFAAMNPVLSDFFTSSPDPTATVVARVIQPRASNRPPAPSASAAVSASASPQPSASVSPAPSASRANFTPDYQTAGDESVNFRTDAGTDNSQTIAVLTPGTPLQSTGQQQNLNGVIWMEFTDSQGRTGWIRQIDVERTS